jgi:hypothetical protein
MPDGDAWKDINILRRAEEEIRNGKEIDINSLGLNGYWADLARLLLVFALTKKGSVEENRARVDVLAKEMSSDFFPPIYQRP